VLQVKLKVANAVNVRHILCEKHSRATEALEKIRVSEAFTLHSTTNLQLTDGYLHKRLIPNDGINRVPIPRIRNVTSDIGVPKQLRLCC
jgi:hypothetical protein